MKRGSGDKSTANTIIKREHILCNHANHQNHIKHQLPTSGHTPEAHIHQLNSSFNSTINHTNSSTQQTCKSEFTQLEVHQHKAPIVFFLVTRKIQIGKSTNLKETSPI